MVRGLTILSLVVTLTGILGQAESDKLEKSSLLTIDAQDAIAGRPFVLVCNHAQTRDVDDNDDWNLTWKYPSAATADTSQHGKSDPDEEYWSNAEEPDRLWKKRLQQNNLTVTHASPSHDGLYTCQLTKTSSENGTVTQKEVSLTVKVYPVSAARLQLFQPEHSVVRVSVWRTVKFVVKFDAFPKPSFRWQHQFNGLVRDGEQTKDILTTPGGGEWNAYTLATIHNATALRLNGVSAGQAGNYTVFASTPYHNASVSFLLEVNVPPRVVSLDIRNATGFKLTGYALTGTPVTATCSANGFPLPNITWQVQECERCGQDQFVEDAGVWHTIPNHDSFHGTKATSVSDVESTLTTDRWSSGYLRCRAENHFDGHDWTDVKIDRIRLTDVENGSSAILITGPPIEGQNVRLVCRFNLHEFRNVTWQRTKVDRYRYEESPYEIVENGYPYLLTQGNSKFSHVLTLDIMSFDVSKIGRYLCTADYANGTRNTDKVPPAIPVVLIRQPLEEDISALTFDKLR